MDKISVSLNIAGTSCYDTGEYNMDIITKCGALAKKSGVNQVIIPDVVEDIDTYAATIKEVAASVDLPVTGFINAKKFDDVKYTLYAGAAKVIMVDSDGFFNAQEIELINESSLRFGKEKIEIYVPIFDDKIDTKDIKEIKLFGAGSVAFPNYSGKHYEGVKKLMEEVEFPVSIGFDGFSSSDHVKEILLSCEALIKIGVTSFFIMNFNCEEEELLEQFMKGIKDLEQKLLTKGASTMSFSELKLNSDGLIPVIVQDYKTDEVLMMAYMNEEAYNKTLETETMTYFSRSRQSLWVKGETSGHFQYVKELKVDCDKDTLLAKVKQIGVACHTGNPTCFYTDIMKKEYDGTNPLKVFQEEYDIILDRKNNPKEGSYTNYLFDKGVDKILKKVGEEATEIVIAAKNPDSEELKYEIADFLYHAMVLMVDKGVTWDEVVEAIAKRR